MGGLDEDDAADECESADEDDCYLPLLNFGGDPTDVSRGSSSFPPLRGPRPEDVV